MTLNGYKLIAVPEIVYKYKLPSIRTNRDYSILQKTIDQPLCFFEGQIFSLNKETAFGDVSSNFISEYPFAELPEEHKINLLRQAVSLEITKYNLNQAYKNCYIFPLADPNFPPFKAGLAFMNYGFFISFYTINGQVHIIFDPKLFITEDGISWNYNFSTTNSELFRDNFLNYDQFVGIIKEAKNRFGKIGKISFDGGSFCFEESDSIPDNHISSTGHEPNISFGDGMTHTFPAAGLKRFGAWDQNKLIEERPTKVTVGIMGNNLINPLLTKVKDGDRSGMYGFPGFQKVYKVPLDGSKSQGVVVLTEEEISQCSDVADLSQLFISKFKELGMKCDVLVIELPAAAKTMFQDINLHDLLKVIFWGERMPTQIILQETVNKNQSLIVDNLALGLYVGAGGKPWILDEPFPDSIFMGISFGVSKDQKKIVGIVEVFDRYGLSLGMMVNEIKNAGAIIDEEKEFHLTQNQVQKLLESIIHKFSKLEGEHPKNITLHKTTPFNDEEIRALEELEKNFDVNINMVYINAFGSNLCLVPNNTSFPPQRLQYWKFQTAKALLYTLGISQSISLDPFIPKPMIVELHAKSSKSDYTVEKACEDIVKLTKLNWNSSASYEREPVTISRSRKMVALLRAGLALNDVPEDVRYFI